MRRYLLAASALMAFGAMGTAANANTIQAEIISSGSNTIAVVPNPLFPSQMIYFGNVGVKIGTNGGVSSSPFDISITTNNDTTNIGNTTDFQLLITQYGFPSVEPKINLTSSFDFNNLNAPGSTVSFQNYLGTKPFDLSTLIASTPILTGNPLSTYVAPTFFASGLTVPLSETLVYNFHMTSGSLSASDSIAVPEPASMALLGAGLAGLGFINRRKRSPV